MTTIADLKAFTADVEGWALKAANVAMITANVAKDRDRLIAAGRALGLRVPHLETMLPLAAMTEVAEDLTAGSFEAEGAGDADFREVDEHPADADRAALTGTGDQCPEAPACLDASKRAKG